MPRKILRRCVALAALLLTFSLPLIADDQEAASALGTEVIQTFPERFEHFYRAGMQRKLGLTEAREGDAALAQDLLTRMAENAADFTLTFRRLADLDDQRSDGLGRSTR